MKKIAVLFLLLSALSYAGPTNDEYSISVHVVSSRWAMEPAILNGPQPIERLKVVIDGKKYELAAPAPLRANLQAGVTLLALGDYKAKLVQDVHKTAYESSQAYEFQFSDKKTRKFFVVGQSE